MKKIFAISLFTISLFAFTSAFAEPSYLWYEVTAYNPDGWTHFDIARIGVANAEGVLESVYLANVVDASTTVPFVESDATKSEAYGWADLSVYASADYWFYVEAYKDGLQVLDYDPETAVNYSDILAGNHISSNIEDPLTASITPWVVPEPTSGFLLLLGLASLALRRRRGILPRQNKDVLNSI